MTPLEIELITQVKESNRLLKKRKLLMDAISHGEKTFKSREMEKIFSGDNKPFMSDEIFRFQERKFNAKYVPKLECNPTDLIGYERWGKKLRSTITGFGLGYLMRDSVIQAYLGEQTDDYELKLAQALPKQMRYWDQFRHDIGIFYTLVSQAVMDISTKPVIMNQTF